MNNVNLEVAVIEEASATATDASLCQLSDLQLALVGGGNGEVSPY